MSKKKGKTVAEGTVDKETVLPLHERESQKLSIEETERQLAKLMGEARRRTGANLPIVQHVRK